MRTLAVILLLTLVGCAEAKEDANRFETVQIGESGALIIDNQTGEMKYVLGLGRKVLIHEVKNIDSIKFDSNKSSILVDDVLQYR